MSEDIQLAVVDLTRPEALDLQRELDRSGTVGLVEQGTVDKTAARVLVTSTVVVTLGALAIQGLTVWLSKNRSSVEIEQEVEIRHPDGRVERRRLRFKRSESSTPENVHEILKSMKIPDVQ